MFITTKKNQLGLAFHYFKQCLYSRSKVKNTIMSARSSLNHAIFSKIGYLYKKIGKLSE